MAFTLRDRRTYTYLQEAQFFLGPVGSTTVLVLVEAPVQEGFYPLLEWEALGPLSAYLPQAGSDSTYALWRRQWRRRYAYEVSLDVTSQIRVKRTDRSGITDVQIAVYQGSV